MQSANRKRWLIIFAGVISLILIIVAIILSSGADKKPAANPDNSYVDPLSHETISNPPGKGPDTFGSTPNTPIYLGIDKLIDHGLSYDQTTALRSAFNKYASSQNPPVKEVSIDVDHITTQHDSTKHNSPFIILFKTRFDRKTDYQAKVQYHGLNDVQLILTDPADNKSVFDSGVMSSAVAE
jgi:hypothetical protein